MREPARPARTVTPRTLARKGVLTAVHVTAYGTLVERGMCLSVPGAHEGDERVHIRGSERTAALEDFYRQRNLLKTRVTGEHVGNAVVFFAANLTPTTGATLPVDGGVPDAFPR